MVGLFLKSFPTYREVPGTVQRAPLLPTPKFFRCSHFSTRALSSPLCDGYLRMGARAVWNQIQPHMPPDSPRVCVWGRGCVHCHYSVSHLRASCSHEAAPLYTKQHSSVHVPKAEALPSTVPMRTPIWDIHRTCHCTAQSAEPFRSTSTAPFSFCSRIQSKSMCHMPRAADAPSVWPNSPVSVCLLQPVRIQHLRCGKVP